MNRTPVTNGFEKNGLKFSSEEIDFVPKFSDANEFQLMQKNFLHSTSIFIDLGSITLGSIIVSFCCKMTNLSIIRCEQYFYTISAC